MDPRTDETSDGAALPSGPAGRAALAEDRSNAGPGWATVLIGIALVVAVAGISFAAGRLTVPQVSAVGQGGLGGAQVGPGRAGVPGGPGGGLGGPGGGVSLEGTVASVDGRTLTLKLANGQTVQVSLADTTTYHAQTSATGADVTSGSKVLIRVNGFRPDAGGAGGGLTANDVTIVP